MFTRLLFNSLLLSLVFLNAAQSQPELSPFNLHPPLEGNLLLSGVFGEVRTNSFHAGIDFRTGGRSGAKVFSSDDGFVARVRVSGLGFGKALYIQHPNGLTTVYAHLDKFSSSIDAFVKEYQYNNKRFEVDVHLNPNQLKIKRGDIIGLSGNTGSSGGPHLHYEVRRTAQQVPLNPSFSNLKINDILPPSIRSGWVFPLDSSSFINGKTSKSELIVLKNKSDYIVVDTVYANGLIGLGLEVYDFINSGSLRCGVYSIKMSVNNEVRYHFSVDQFMFSETRYANSHIDYAIRQQTGKRVHKLYRDPNNLFPGYQKLQQGGRLNVCPDSIYNIKIIASDAYGNSSSLLLVIKGESTNHNTRITPDYPTQNIKSVLWLFYNQNYLETDHFIMSMPKNSLYENLNFTFSISDVMLNTYSPIIHIHNPYTPIHRPYRLSIKADSLPYQLYDKALVGTIDSKGSIVSAGGAYSEGYVNLSVNYFGDFFIMVDTIAPSITPLNIFKDKDMSKDMSIRFTVKDELSGVAKINGFINNEWALFEYDPKNNLVFYEFDKDRLERNLRHDLVLKVEDSKGNEAEYKTFFVW